MVNSKWKWVLAMVTILTLAWLLLRPAIKETGVETQPTDEHISSTKAVIDSIRSIGQWELMVLDVQTDVDTICESWFGLRHNRLTRRYYGRISLGIDFSDSPSEGAAWQLPSAKVLDENFIDESRTQVIISEDGDIEQSPAIRRDMLRRARQKMLQEAVTPARLTECQQKAHQELQRLLKLTKQ